MRVLGINAVSHYSAAALVVDGETVAGSGLLEIGVDDVSPELALLRASIRGNLADSEPQREPKSRQRA